MPVGSLDDIELQEAVDYSGRDADVTMRVDTRMDSMHRDLGLGQIELIDLGAIPMFERMWRVGMLIDPGHFEAFSVLLQSEMDRLQVEIDDLAGEHINPNSGDQKAYLMYGKLGMETTRRTKSGKREATDKKALAQNQSRHPVVSKLREYGEMQKLKSTYSDAIPLLAGEDGRIHGDFRITRTPTGQLAVGEPNLLAMPAGDFGKEIRRGFVAAEGNCLGSWDLQGFHFRVMAHLSEDEKLCKLFRDGRDVHAETAAQMFGIPLGSVDKNKHRRPAKTVGLGIINGLTGVGLSAQFDLAAAAGEGETHDQDECEEFIKAWFDVYPGVANFQHDAVNECRRFGFVRDQWGRLRYLPNIHSALGNLRSEAERQSFSHKIQSTSHGVLKQAMAAIWKYLLIFWGGDNRKYYVEPILQVHDELLFELREMALHKVYWSAAIKECLCNTVELRVPLESSCSFAGNWAELK